MFYDNSTSFEWPLAGSYSISMIRKHCCVLSILCSQQEAPVCPARSIPFFYILNHFLHMVGDQWNKYSLNQWANKWRNWPFQTKFVHNLCPQFRGPSYDSHSVWSSNACSQTRKACITQAQRSRKPGKKNLANTDMYPAIPCKKKCRWMIWMGWAAWDQAEF